MDEYERGTRISKVVVDIYFASKDYIDAYRALRRAQKRGEANEEEKLFEAVARMRELVAHCVLYLRENPEDRDGISQIIDQIIEERTDDSGRPKG
jgi:hypothetical protein